MTPRHDSLVSIVSPIYNVAPYLREAIESVLSQTHQNWDYILVDNCSTDGTRAIAEEYSARDSRIRVCSNPQFVRVLENHNIALREISPKSTYCKVLAGDDWMYPECLEKMIDVFQQHPSVVIVGAYAGRGSSVAWTGLDQSTVALSGRDACRSFMLGGPCIFGTPSSVLYRSDIVRSRHAFFNESNVHGDTEVCCEFLEHADFGFVHQVLTHARVRSGSVTAITEPLNTLLPWGLLLLDKYGPRYLDRLELERRTREEVRNYYRYLGQQLFKFRNAEFWAMHTQKLAELGRPLNRARLALAAAGVAADVALNPKHTLEAVGRRLASRRHAIGAPLPSTGITLEDPTDAHNTRSR